MTGNTAVLCTEKFMEIWGADGSRSRRSPKVWTLVAGSGWERMREQRKEREWRAQSRGGVGQTGDNMSYPQASETVRLFL